MKLSDLFKFIIDEDMLDDEVKFVKDGKVVLTVVNVGTEADAAFRRLRTRLDTSDDFEDTYDPDALGAANDWMVPLK